MNRFIVLVLLLAAAALAPAADRYNTFLFGVAYYPEQWPESYWERDARMMQEAGVNVVRMGEFAWYAMEPREDVFDFSLFDRAIAVLARHGIKTILGTPTAAPPKWLTARYPEVRAVTADGRAMDDQTRRHYCYNSPVYRRLARRIVEAMAQHFRDHPDVIGWQIDNEFNCNLPECYSDSCRAAFREWLRGRYGDLHSLNTRWGTAFWSQSYDNWGEVDLPFAAPAAHNPALMLDFKRFISDSVISFQREQTDILRRLHPEDFITHNGTFKNIDYYRFSRDLDIYAHDNYPVFQPAPRFPVGAQLTLARGFRGRFLIMEQQTGAGGQDYLLRAPRPGEMSLWAFQALAHGADGLLHFRWRTARRGAEEYWGGVLDQENVPGPRYEEFRREGGQIRRLGPELLGSRVISDMAALKDFDDEWVFDYQYLTREVNVAGEFRDLFQAASELGYNIDFIGRAADFSRYKVLFGPHLALMNPDLAQKIRRFVERGGTFILEAHSAIKDRDNAVLEQPKPALLADLFGVTVEGLQCYQPPSRNKNAVRFADGAAVPVHVFAERLKPAKARPLAAWSGDFLRGAPAVTENRAGAGRAVYYGSFFNLEAARYLIRRYAAEHKLRPLLDAIPAGVEVTRRTRAPREYYFLLNHGDSPAALKLPARFLDALSNTPAPLSLTLRPLEYRVYQRAIAAQK